MSGKKKLSIGITVNLENYENLKVEVEGEGSGEREADELIEYLDTVLSRLGRNDPETAKKIDSYRRRVLENPGEYVNTSQDDEIPKSDHELYQPETEEIGEITEEEILIADTPDEPQPDVKPAEENGFTCSSCGMPISKAEEQLSQIFMGRSLCKKCLEELQK